MIPRTKSEQHLIQPAIPKPTGIGGKLFRRRFKQLLHDIAINIAEKIIAIKPEIRVIRRLILIHCEGVLDCFDYTACVRNLFEMLVAQFQVYAKTPGPRPIQRTQGREYGALVNMDGLQGDVAFSFLQQVDGREQQPRQFPGIGRHEHLRRLRQVDTNDTVVVDRVLTKRQYHRGTTPGGGIHGRHMDKGLLPQRIKLLQHRLLAPKGKEVIIKFGLGRAEQTGNLDGRPHVCKRIVGVFMFNAIGFRQTFQPETRYAGLPFVPVKPLWPQRVSGPEHIDHIPPGIAIAPFTCIGIMEVSVSHLAGKLIVKAQIVEPGDAGFRNTKRLHHAGDEFTLAHAAFNNIAHQNARDQHRFRMRDDIGTWQAEKILRLGNLPQIQIRPDAGKLQRTINDRVDSSRFIVIPIKRFSHNVYNRRFSRKGQTVRAEKNIIVLIIGPLVACLGFFMLQGLGWQAPACWTAAITIVCAIWWIFEPIPIPVTSLIPLAGLPMVGVLTPAQVGESYGSPLVLLLMGGFILSTAMAKSGAHRRVALTMINLFGGASSKRLVFGFMAAAALLSMWISNTATTLMLLPVALAVIERSDDKALAIPLLLGVAYAANVGGIGTPIGTPPNLIFREIYEQNTGMEIGFITWMSWGVPVVILLVPLIGFWLTRSLNYRIQTIMPDVGAWQTEERRVLTLFALTALAWVTRSQPFGGWKTWLDLPTANDASVALIAVVVMFLIPNGKGGRLLDWDSAAKIPWGMLILFGGGIAIARAFITSGLSQALGDALAGIAGWPLLAMIAVICLCITFLTEMTSNTATTALMMPILAAAAIAADIEPALLMVPAAMSASCAFMLPVATAPNTIVFSTGRFPISLMAREGVVLNFIGVGVISLMCYLLL